MCSNPSIHCLRWGWLPSCLFAQLRARRTPRGTSPPIGKPFSEERIRQAWRFVGARFGHGRVAWSSRNASRIYHGRSHESLDVRNLLVLSGFLVGEARYVPNTQFLSLPFRSELIQAAA